VGSPDGKLVWMVDNNHHRLIQVDLASGVQSVLGQQGESLGQLNHPFMIALGREGAVLVTDMLNGRVASFTAAAAPTTAIGAYGVDMGQLYRPKGVACDPDGNVWVSDSVMGVLQVFDSRGRLLDALRDDAGNVLHLNTPTGVAIDTKGDVYVTELTGDRVTKFEITRGPVSPESLQARREAPVTGAQARACTLCHVEWMEPFSRNEGTPLMEPPVNSPAEPAVSRAETCLSCHDGSVIDSRRKVWFEHGHRTGVEPPASMKVPSALPLVDGKIACRTCHSAHASGQFNADMSTAVFLRVQNSAGELCIGCHADKTRGPQLGTHPTGGMPWPVPKALVDAGAKVGPNPRELTCVVCHTPHGSANDHLLVLGTQGNELCVTCHDQIRPGMFRAGGNAEHPLSPLVNSEQIDAIKQMGTKLSPDGRLICLSCHQLHHGKGERFMLADELTDGGFCIQCHSNKTTVLATSHDLRAKFPEERNRLGMTPSSGGPCSSCHMFHRYARAPESSELDPGGGKCITCHQKGACAESKSLGVANHPKAACVDCHDPHKPELGHYLRAPVSQLCINCHKEYVSLDGGPHDYRSKSEAWPSDSLAANDRCMVCHRPHGDAKTGVFRIPPTEGVAQSDGACVACHPGSNWNDSGKFAALHPQKLTQEVGHGDLPIVSALDGADAVGCRTCHNPHLVDGRKSSFLRVAAGKPSQSLCATCHVSQSAIALTGHASENLIAAGVEADSCKPCHTVHARPTDVGPHLLASIKASSAVGHNAESNCVSCHHAGGIAPVPAIAVHPDVPMFIAAKEADLSSLPLFNRQGHVDAQGSITCATCHTPHGRLPDGPARLGDLQPRLGSLELLAAQPAPQRRAMRLMLRQFKSPNVCINCHGADALRRFLYFHDPQRRGGSLNESRPAPVIRRKQV
jgi:predicted CXXCH cytochrome family protein